MTQFRTAILTLAAALLAACSNDSSPIGRTPTDPVPTPKPVAKIEIWQEAPFLDVGESLQLVVSLKDAGGQPLTDRAIHWHSDNADIASIGQNGRVTAVAPGVAQVIATSEGKSDTSVVTVKWISVSTISLNQNSLSLEAQDAATLVAVTRAANGDILTGRLVSWGTSDASIATVDENGVVVARKPGLATISAVSEGKQVNAPVTVWPRPTADLLYQRSVPDTNQIFTLSLTNAGGAPHYINAGSVSFRPAASPDGMRIAFAVHMAGPNGGKPVDDIYVVDRFNGANIKRVTISDGVDEFVSFATDGTDRVAFTHQDPTTGRQDIWLSFVNGSGQYCITCNGPMDEQRSAPAWSPDGQWIAYSVTKDVAAADRGSIWIMRPDGTGKRRLTSSAGFDTRPTWSPDGSRIAFARAGDIAIVTVATGAVTSIPLAGTQISPAWSPDGQHIAFSMRDPLNDFGNFEIWTVRPDGLDLRRRVRDVSNPLASAVSPTWIR